MKSKKMMFSMFMLFCMMIGSLMANANLPDLAITKLYLNRQCEIVVHVKNIGRGLLPDSVYTDINPKSPSILISQNGGSTGGITIWKLDPGRQLQKPGGEIKWSFGTVGNTPTSVEAEVDKWNVINEITKANNKMTKKLSCKDNSAPTEIFKVTRVAVTVSPATFSGPCPHKFEFTGKIAANGAGTVKYKWIRNDGANAPEQTLVFSKAEIKSVQTTWTLGGAGKEYIKFWQAIEILTPNPMTSNKAYFDLKCAGGSSENKLPDLIVSDMKLIENCKIKITIKNIGQGGVSAAGYDMNNGVAIQMYNGSQAWGGIRLGGIDPAGALKSPGGSVSHIWFPSASNLDLTADTHTIKLIVDANNAEAESNENNNTLTKKLSCDSGNTNPSGKKPNVGLYGFLKIGKNQKEVKWGETLTLTPADAHLISNGKPAFDFYYSFREYAGTAVIGPFKNKLIFNDKEISIQSNLAVDALQIKPIHTQGYAGPENGKLYVKIDADNEVAENDENNNSGFVNLKFEGFDNQGNTGYQPCGIKLTKLSKTSGAPGEEFEMYGIWGDSQGAKIPCINKGKMNKLIVLSWSNTVLKVKIPTGLAAGQYKAGVYCNDLSLGGSYSSGWLDFTIN
jgi:hypothetical protein